MEGTVWVSEWQLRCCGDPFEVGTWVQWHATPPDVKWLTDMFGADVAATVVGMEERHDRLEGATALAGRVRSIRAVTHQLEQRPDGLYPAPDTTVLTEVANSDEWEGPLTFAGFLVEVSP